MSTHAREYVDGLPVRPIGAKYVLYRIAAMISDETFECFPGQEFLARCTSCSQSQVKRHIAALVAAGILIRGERKNTKNGFWKSNVYKISGFEAWIMRRKRGDYWDPEEALKASLVERHFESMGHPCPMDEIKPIHGAPMPPIHGAPMPRGHGAWVPHESKESLKKESKERLSSEISAKDAYFAGERSVSKRGKGKRQGSLPIEETEEARTDVDGLAAMDEADFKAFCSAADEFGLAKPERLSALRREKLRSIRREHGGSAWRRALDAIKASSFLQGKGGKEGCFRCTFDKLLDPEFFLKVIEGNYADKPRGNVVKLVHATPEAWEFRLKVWRDNGYERWSRVWGPAPGEPGCLAPPDALARYAPPNDVLPDRNTGSAESA